MRRTIKSGWKIFCYGVKREHYSKSISIREFLERLSLDCFDNPFLTYTETFVKNIPLLDEVDDEETVATCRCIYFFTSLSTSTQSSSIYDLTFPSASSLDFSLYAYTLSSQNNIAKKESKQRVKVETSVGTVQVDTGLQVLPHPCGNILEPPAIFN